MKELPLLPSNFKSFSWEESVGNATVEQLQQSYNAITNNGWTTEFSKVVWNDLVDLLYQAIIKSGFTWDDTYGSYTGTKMLEKNNVLTSKRFNAVTLNIDNLINTTWKWSVDNTVKGYLGRSRVYGYEEKWVRADYVYGWYIVELARVLNVLIAILKNDANFAEFAVLQTINTNPKVNITPSPSAPLNVVQQIVTNDDVVLLERQSCRLNVLWSIRSRELNELLPRLPKHLEAYHNYKTYNESIMNVKSAGKVNHKSSLKTENEVAIRFRGAERFYSYKSHQFEDEACLTLRDFEDICTYNRIYSYEETSIKPVESNQFVSNFNNHITNPYSELDSIESYHINAKGQTYSNEETLLDHVPPFGIKAKDVALYTDYEALMYTPKSNPLGHVDGKSYSDSEAIMNTPNVGYFVTEGTIAFNELANIKPSIPTPIEASNKSASDGEGLLDGVNPVHISAGYSSYSHDENQMIIRDSTPIASKDSVFTSNIGEMVTKKVLDLYSNIKSFSRHIAGLSFEGSDEPWVIQTGSNLYIKQVYTSNKDESDLSIDVLYYIEPIQEGSNLYIRQDFMEGDDE